MDRYTFRDGNGKAHIKKQPVGLASILCKMEDAGHTLESALSLLQKQQEGMVVELPCRLGDTVWHISKGVNSGEWMPVTSHTVTNIYLNIGKEPKFQLTETYGTFKLSDFGKCVFLTRADAEKAKGEG